MTAPVTPPTRRGICPALTAPMATGDGLLVRLVPADGWLTLDQMKGLADAARAHGNGIIEITAKGSVQLRGLTEQSVGPLNAAVNALGITPRTGLPVDVSPLSGIDAQEVVDARLLAARLHDMAADLLPRLGAKVSVVVDGGGALSLDAFKTDVRLVARPMKGAQTKGEKTWDVWLAGDAARALPFGAARGRDAPELVRSLLERLAALGPSARMADALPPAPAVPPRPMREASPIGLFALKDGTFACGVGLPFGALHADDLDVLAAAARTAGARDLRPAPDHGLLATGLTPQAADGFRATAQALGCLISVDDPRRFVAACPGAPACASAHIPARALAPQVAQALAEVLDGSLSVHVSACTKGCAHPAPAHLTLVGLAADAMDNRVALVREGRAGDATRPLLAAEALIPALARLGGALAAARRPGESAGETLARLPPAALEPFLLESAVLEFTR
ncbi:precorrin-3B synthase [Azorhizobium oxalatiphilum]|uniref:Precorrin-3B synthase n=1 Tax=Azorhizobium oxalatiphilum TaxID=980631 RepID=A0A917F4M3_9HYPH|nr:precorrin-3B synthase [Azorhizobium oxalatiphilum]GGF46138.1 precorrin-3B synthase [Azorhizobium oxalatiphilum]